VKLDSKKRFDIKWIISYSLVAIGVFFLLLLLTGRYIADFIDVGRYKVELAWKTSSQSPEKGYRIYSAVLDESPGSFYKRKIAIGKIIEIGNPVLPWVMEEIRSNQAIFDKKLSLLNIIGNVDPNIYCNLYAGPPFSEITIEEDLAKSGFEVSVIQKANISAEQKQKIFDRIESWGDEKGNKFRSLIVPKTNP
jgi:hypothetical protein